jgi:DnaJ domain
MMDRVPALWIAIDLRNWPSRAKEVRSKPLPDGVSILLRIAAGDEEVTGEASASVGRPREIVREAAAFFIEQILFCPEADSYRVLGAAPGATYADLRRNMALLLRWLHPDVDPHGERAIFTQRVTRAWSDLKTDERRAAYDWSKRMSGAEKPIGSKKTRAESKSSGASHRHRRPHYGRPHQRLDGIRRPLGLDRVEQKGLLRQILNLLFKRVAL